MKDDIQDIFELAALPPNDALRDQLWGRVLKESATDATVASATTVLEGEVLRLQPHVAKSRRPVWLGAMAASLILAIGVGAVLQGRKQQHVTTTPTAPANPSTETSVSGKETSVPASPSTVPPTTEAPTSTTQPSTTVSALDPSVLAPGAATWESLPASGLSPRVAPLVANAGNRVLVVGGQKELYTSDGFTTYQAPATRTDGAILDLTTKTWTRIAEAPVPLNNADVAQWDGEEVLVLAPAGTTVGYNPSTNSWRYLAEFPLRSRQFAASTWTGSEMLILGGSDFIPDQNGGLTAIRNGAAYRPATNTWRSISDPSADADWIAGSLWTEGRWIVAWSALGDGTGGPNQVQVVKAYDPKTDTWSKVAGLPDNRWIVRFGKTPATVIQQLPANPNAVVAAADDASIWELNSAGAWRPIGEAHMGDQVSVVSLNYVDGHPVVYADAGGQNGFYLGYGQASGAWVRFDHFNAGPDFPPTVSPILTETGRLLETDGTNAALLAPIVDPTITVAPCTAKDVGAKAIGAAGNATITLTNQTSKPCTINGQRPSVVILNGPGHAPLAQPESIFYNRSQSNNGGFIGSGSSAALIIFGQQDPTPDGKPCPVRGTVDSITFSLSDDADRVTVPIQLPEGCWDLRAIDALIG
jgi:hypothetical protein